MQKISFLVMMSTYNGDKYLVEQLDSIFSQINVDVNLLIRDDGSSDKTLDILKDYAERYKGRVKLLTGDNIGWKRSFHTLIQDAGKECQEYDYFAFADQDDIWLPDKLNKAAEALSKLENGAALYCSNQFYYKDGKVEGLINSFCPIPTEKGCLVRNYATGCTIVFNRSLMEYLSVGGSPEYNIAHDYWCYMVAVLCGHVVIDPNAYIWYRQHDANQIGSKNSWRDTWKRRLRSLSGYFGDHYRERVAQELLRHHGEHMTKRGREAVEKLAGYRKSIKSRIDLFLDKEYTLNSQSNDFWLKLRIILGRL